MTPSPEGPTWERLENQIRWYDRRGASNQRAYRRLKAIELVVAASIPVVAAFGTSVIATGVLGAVVVVLEGFQQLGQYQQRWFSYRSTAQALTREKYLYLAGVSEYGGLKPMIRLAERVEELLAQEATQWAASADSGSA